MDKEECPGCGEEMVAVSKDHLSDMELPVWFQVWSCENCGAVAMDASRKEVGFSKPQFRDGKEIPRF